MAPMIAHTRRLLERARWKQSDWDKSTPEDVLEEYATAGGTHIVHMSEVGPGQEATTPAETPDASPFRTEYTDPRPVGGFKVGLNPETDFNTPAGVYGYPLNDRTYRRWFGDVNRPPFAEDRPWMYVIRLDRNGLVALSEDGTASSWSAARTKDVVERILHNRLDLVQSALASETGEELSVGERDFMGFARTDFYDIAIKTAKLQTPFVQFWNLTRMIAHEGGSGTSTWTSLLVDQANITGIVDHGSTTLHENEPIQAVSLAPSARESEAAVPNVWDWRAAKRERRQQQRNYETFEEAGWGDLFGQIKLNDDLKARHIIRTLERHPWLVEQIRQTGGKVPLTADHHTLDGLPSSYPLFIRNLAVRGGEVPDDVPTWAKFGRCAFDGCSFNARFFDNLEADTGSSMGSPSVFFGCAFRGCVFEVSRARLRDAVSSVHADVGVDEVVWEFHEWANRAENRNTTMSAVPRSPGSDELTSRMSDALKSVVAQAMGMQQRVTDVQPRFLVNNVDDCRLEPV